MIEDGYELWMRYVPVTDVQRLAEYRQQIPRLIIDSTNLSPTFLAAREELSIGLNGLLGGPVPIVNQGKDGLVIGTPQNSPVIAGMTLPTLGDEGFILSRDQDRLILAANTDKGILYGAFHLLRQLQTRQPLHSLDVISVPGIKYRMLNHWDNLDRTVERGYAGFSLWDWHKLPDYVSPQYRDYARANASIGINGTVLTNPNAHALSLTHPYLVKAAALAEVFRPYAIRVYLSARFSAPVEIGGLKTADPLAPEVAVWWQDKIDEIYALIPDFGGFLVKANSEGQPGPRDYARTQAEGANMLANLLAPKGGIVNWRAFIYDNNTPDDRHKQAYSELVPLDGRFAANTFLQVKNGAIDFQPREPFHPIFGAMPNTNLSLEVQITQEYLGNATHLVYLAPLFKETLDADTCAKGAGSRVAHVIDGSLDGHPMTGIAGVANIGTDRNWCGHPFAAANWYAFGRLAWDHRLSSEGIAEEWLRMTFSNDPRLVASARAMMMQSREAVVNYMTPLGLHHLMARNHHYGPGPWVEGGRADWTSPYYHRADSQGIGFDRTPAGSDAVSQYRAPWRDQIAHLESCPETLLLWFHHVSWQHRMISGRTLWDELCYRYHLGVATVREMQQTWALLDEFVDAARFEHVATLLRIQEKEARWWRDACLLYFQTFSRLPIPAEYEQPAETLAYYKSLTHYFVPGIPEMRF